MPIKSFKGFARRKSSGNVLEEAEAQNQSSFRVFERPPTGRKSLSEGNLLRQLTGEGRNSSSPPEDDNIFASSDGPAYRNLTGGNTSDGPTAARFSSSARRSTDLQTQFESQPPQSRNNHDIPAPHFSNALRAAGRTLSFGGRFSKSFTQAPPRPPSPNTPRSRANTNSTSSTATPPKLLDTEFQIGRMDDDFGKMFDGIGKQNTQEQNQQFSTSRNPRERSPRPAPISTDRSKQVGPSPYSWGSRQSEEGLLAVDGPPQDTVDSTMVPPPLGPRRKSSPMFNAEPANTTSHRSLDRPTMTTDRGLRRSVLFPAKRSTAAFDDEDAKLVMASLDYSKRNSQAHASTPSADFEADEDVPLFGPSSTNHTPVHHTPVRRGYPYSKAPNDDNVDASIAAHARLAAEYESKPQPAPNSNKIMTPSQFEHYRQQQELKRANSEGSDSEESTESDFDEEDEAEKNRETERQRRKQEAHLSVYRQQMMKVTGQQAPSPSLRPDGRASSSTPNLTNLSLHPGNQSGSGKSSEGDEDEEIPLGILAAHGFPSRNRPPGRLMSSNSMSNLQASYQQPHLGSAGSDIGAGNRSSLPVFARNLPRDPYFGASLVTPSNRESLALGGGGSVYGGQPAAAASSSALPPGGLVGVIATEERARAMRRGSPNSQAMYDHQPGMPGHMGNMGGIPRPHTMLGMNSPNAYNGPSPQLSQMSATEQAQVQLSQQMSSMMQMQMQWMQQMISMQGGQGPPPQLASPNFPIPFSPNANARPSSMPAAGGPFLNAPQGYGDGNQRTLSMIDPNASSRLNSPAGPFVSGANRPGTPSKAGYTPSIAPSERSNVGLAPRYRPVSTLPAEAESGSFLAPSKPFNDENRRSTFLAPPAHASAPNPTIRPVSSFGRINASPSKLSKYSQPQQDEEDDDEGWAEMMKKREKKRTNWKVKKESSTFGEDLLNAVH
ncbi:hypothetical protein BDV18DRAFT_11102 [Aspergillus unguis]